MLGQRVGKLLVGPAEVDVRVAVRHEVPQEVLPPTEVLCLARHADVLGEGCVHEDKGLRGHRVADILTTTITIGLTQNTSTAARVEPSTGIQQERNAHESRHARRAQAGRVPRTITFTTRGRARVSQWGGHVSRWRCDSSNRGEPGTHGHHS